jgi:zinc protease
MSLRIQAVAVLLTILLGSSFALGKGKKPLVTTLENGVTVAIIENHEAPVVALRLYVKAGSMTEGKYLGCGVTHLLEHLISGGTTGKRTEAESRAILDSIGAQTNAYTSTNITCYFMSIPSRFFNTGLDLTTDWVMNGAITQAEFDREKQVVLREMDTRASHPGRALNRLMSETMYKIHPVRVPVIGYKDAFKKLTRENVLDYYRRMYVPNNTVFVVAGDINPEKALADIRAAFAPFKRRPVPTVIYPKEPRQIGPREATKTMPVRQAYLRLSFRTVPLNHPDLYPLDLLSYVLSKGPSSRLVRVLRDEKKLVTSINSWSYTPSYNAGEFGIQAELSPANIPAAKAAILAELRRVVAEKVTEAELKRAKRQKVSTHIFALQTVEKQAASLGGDLLSTYDPEFSDLYVTRIQQTTPDQMLAAAKRYFDEERLCVAILRPPVKKGGETAPKSAGTKALPAKLITLPNGLRVILKRNPSQPIVAIRAVAMAGLRAEPKGKAGLSLATAQLITRGTTTRSAQEIARTLDDMGATLTASSGNNSLYVSAQCLAGDMEKTLALTADVLRNPAFTQEEIDRLRPRLIAARQRIRDRWTGLLFQTFRQNFFATHPYRFSAQGEVADLKSITRDDVIKFYKRWCVPNNTVLAVYGDIDADKVAKLVSDCFGGWDKAKGFTPPAPPAESPLKKSEVIRKTFHHPIGGIFIGFNGMTINSKDRYAMDVLDCVVSGISMPRGYLHKALRGTDKGLVYVVHAFSFAGPEPGYFGIYAGCRPGDVDDVRKIILEQLGRITKEVIGKEEMDAARSICLTADILGRQTSGTQAMSAALNELYGLGYDYADKYADKILAVTEADVKAMARKYLTHSKTVIMTPEKKKPTKK